MRNNCNLSDQELSEPYSHLFYQDPAKIPDYILDRIHQGPYPERDALPFNRINDLLDPGYLPLEIGFSNLSNGSVFVAMLTKMENITGEMLDWWFWWYPQNPLRYKIMYPQAHFGISIESSGKAYLERSGPYNQRIWNSTVYPVEDVGAGKDHLSMHFVPPERFGFNTSLFDKANIAAAICGIVGSVKKRLNEIAYMCQLARKTSYGIELRSRCWIGHIISIKGFKEEGALNQLINRKSIKRRLIPREIGFRYCMHCAQEYNNLAAILPELYSNYAQGN